LRKLHSDGEWNFKTSGCSLPVLEASSDEECTPPKITDVASANTDEQHEAALEPYSRFIGETEALRVLFEESAICSSCKKGKLDISFQTKCLATMIHTHCRKCLAHSASTTAQTKIPQEAHDRNTNYAANVLFVLAQLLSDNGSTETSHVVGMLDFPNPSIGETAYPTIEYEIGTKYITIPYAAELIRENLVREVKPYSQSTDEEFDFEKWKKEHTDKPHLVVVEELPKLTVGYDMGWQKWSSGHRYDSHSGHAIPVGVLTNLPIGLVILNRFCRVCVSSEATGRA
jgi:hypothetical protein